MTDLIQANRGPLAEPLIAAAGTDISHWFSPLTTTHGNKTALDAKSPRGKQDSTAGSKAMGKGGEKDATIMGEPRIFVDPQTGLTVPYLPMGRCVLFWLFSAVGDISFVIDLSDRRQCSDTTSDESRFMFIDATSSWIFLTRELDLQNAMWNYEVGNHNMG